MLVIEQVTLFVRKLIGQFNRAVSLAFPIGFKFCQINICSYLGLFRILNGFITRGFISIYYNIAKCADNLILKYQ